MSETAAALGIGPAFEFQGKRYKVVPRNLEMEALFELFVRDNAFKAVTQLQGKADPAAYQQQMEGWRHDSASFAYSFDGVICWRALVSTPGAKHMAFLQLSYANTEVEPELIDLVWADAEAWRRLMALMNEANNPPNSPAPAGPSPPAKE